MRNWPSPNFGERKDGLVPTIVVVHYTAMADPEAALLRLCDPSSEVSAHYLITRQGDVIRMVDETKRAWHAGNGEWRGLGDVNSRSIGIELDNAGDHPFSNPLMNALEHLLRDVRTRWTIDAANVIGHSDMAPGRKSDPGPRFDWARLARQGLAGPTEPVARQKSFAETAKHAGFTAPCADDVLLNSVRLRFAPWRTGPLSEDDFRLCHSR